MEANCSKRGGECSNRARPLLAFLPRDLERYAAIIVSLLCGGQVKVGKGNLLSPLRREMPQSLADDRVVPDFLLMLIAVDEHGGRNDGIGIVLWRGSLMARRRRIDFLIVV